MFPSSSNGDDLSFTNQSMLENSFTDSENPNSSREHHPLPFLHFPEHFLADDNEFFMSDFLSQPQFLGCSSNLATGAEIKWASPLKAAKKTTKKKKNTGNVEKQAVPRKRAGKKDRHSKIYTAQGQRDRRVRLSLQIARKFFDLHDMLGFDKASKTIEWLFSKSNAAIKELAESLPSVKNSCTGGTKSLSSTSETEVVSAIKKTEDTGDQKCTLAKAESLVGTSKGLINRKSRKPIINPIVRESRNKARARARGRTIEKMKMRGLEKSQACSEEANSNDLEQFRSSSPLRTAENFGSSSHEKNSSLKEVAEEEEEENSGMVHLPEHQMDSVSIIEKFLGITTSPRSSSIFDYTHNLGESRGANSQQDNPVYAGNWNNADSDSVQYSYCAMKSMKGSTGNLQASARERTIEKMKMRGFEKSKACSEKANSNDLEQFGSSSPLQTAENFGSSSHGKNSSLKEVAEEEEEEENSSMVHLKEHQMDSVSIIEKFLGITTSPRSSSIFDYTHNLEESRGENSQQDNPVYAGNWNNADSDSVQYSYCAMKCMKGSSTGNLQAENSAIFKINPDFQVQKCSSIYMTIANTNEQNPNSDFKALSDTHDQKPSSLVMTTSNIDSQLHFLDDQFSCNPISDNKYCGLYWGG